MGKMTNNEFLKAIEDACEFDGLTEQTQLMDVEWDSLSSMIVIGLADAHLDVQITAPQLRECQTFGDIIKLIRDAHKV